MKNLHGIEKPKRWSIHFKSAFFPKLGWHWESAVPKPWEPCSGSLEMECAKEHRICGSTTECTNIGAWSVTVCGVLEYVPGIQWLCLRCSVAEAAAVEFGTIDPSKQTPPHDGKSCHVFYQSRCPEFVFKIVKISITNPHAKRSKVSSVTNR